MNYRTFFTTIATIFALATFGMSAQAQDHDAEHHRHSSNHDASPWHAGASLGAEAQNLYYGRSSPHKTSVVATIGLDIGYDYQFHNGYFVGLELGATYALSKACYRNEDECVRTVSGSLVTRHGYAADKWKVYALGGMAVVVQDFSDFSSTWSDEAELAYVVGVGYERDIFDNMYAKVEYRYMNALNDYEEAQHHSLVVGVGYQF